MDCAGRWPSCCVGNSGCNSAASRQREWCGWPDPSLFGSPLPEVDVCGARDGGLDDAERRCSGARRYGIAPRVLGWRLPPRRARATSSSASDVQQPPHGEDLPPEAVGAAHSTSPCRRHSVSDRCHVLRDPKRSSQPKLPILSHLHRSRDHRHHRDCPVLAAPPPRALPAPMVSAPDAVLRPSGTHGADGRVLPVPRGTGLQQGLVRAAGIERDPGVQPAPAGGRLLAHRHCHGRSCAVRHGV
mmetsp:Transcript_28542/g.92599  ORF Transcript_28542/g.92599 Transcript_28542/m.92599 type:complete len:243 (+) Transcript_28542:756-1484(+)